MVLHALKEARAQKSNLSTVWLDSEMFMGPCPKY